MEMTLKEAAEKVGGELVGDPSIKIKRISDLDNCTAEDIVWISKPSFLKKAEASPAAAVIADRSIPSSDKPLIQVDKPKLAFARLAQLFFPPRKFKPGVSPEATVSPKAKIGSGVTIQARAVIEDGVVIGDETVIGAGSFIGLNSRLGSRTRIYPNVTINEDVIVGDACIIHSGTVLGGYGFGYVPDEKGKQVRIPQVGRVVIEDEVEIGCNVCVDRATFGDTIIRRGVKIDNLVQIAHNDDIGENTVISGQTGISGSVKVGRNVVMGGNVGIADHAEIGNNVILGARTGVAPHKKIRDGQIFFGSPGRPIEEAKMLFVMESRMIKEMKNRKGKKGAG